MSESRLTNFLLLSTYVGGVGLIALSGCMLLCWMILFHLFLLVAGAGAMLLIGVIGVLWDTAKPLDFGTRV